MERHERYLDATYQDSVGKMVRNEVYANVGLLIGELQGAETEFSETLQNDLYEYEEEQRRNDPENCDEDWYAEIYEWWIVSDYFGGKLKERGEFVMEYGLMHIWGRQTSGQAILLDSVVCNIYDDMHDIGRGVTETTT